MLRLHAWRWLEHPVKIWCFFFPSSYWSLLLSALIVHNPRNNVILFLCFTHDSQGISAREVIDFFFDKETRLEWEGTLESVEVVETLAEDSIIFHQLHKRVWPSTQRETLFCSHLCQLTNAPRPENMVGHTWMVCNFSLEHDKVPVCFCVCVLAQTCSGTPKTMPFMLRWLLSLVPWPLPAFQHKTEEPDI